MTKTTKKEEIQSPSIDIDISIQDESWIKEFPDIVEWTRQSITDMLASASNIAPEIDAIFSKIDDCEISIVLSNDAQLQSLNKQYRDIDKPTNVLSFCMTCPQDIKTCKDFLSLGDIIMSYERVKSEAAEQKKNFMDHYHHLLVHGFLHLLHYDHENIDDAAVMEDIEISILAEAGVNNPYETV